jgi:REP element-mobilizing transposase RayT
LHGESGAVDRRHNVFGTPFANPDTDRLAMKFELMDQAPYLLDRERRPVVLQSIRDVCSHRGWNLWAAHVRSNHVHTVVEAKIRPEPIMNTFKAYASRALNQLGCDERDRKRWARHGSTRWLAKDDQVQEAIRYVVQGQGEAMEVTSLD